MLTVVGTDTNKFSAHSTREASLSAAALTPMPFLRLLSGVPNQYFRNFIINYPIIYHMEEQFCPI